MAFYSHFLSLIFSSEIERGVLRMSETGGVWLQPAQADSSVPLRVTLQEFHLKPWLKLLQQHLQNDIPTALSGAIEDVPWHLNAHCSMCPYLEDCRADKPYGPDIRALPNVTAGDSKLLQSVALKYAEEIDPGAAPNAVGTLHAALRNDTGEVVATPAMRQRALRAVGAESSNASDLGALTSVLERRAVLKQQLCGTYPANNDGLSIFVALCCDPALGLPFAWTVSATGLSPTSECVPFTSNTKDMKSREEHTLLALLTRLCEIVEALSRSASASKGVTLYVWDAMEKFCLTQLVIKALCGELSALVNGVPGLASRVHYLALVLLDHPQRWHLHTPPSPDALAASSTPRVCELTAQYRALMHLPIAGFYSSTGISAWRRTMDRSSSSTMDISLDTIERVWAQGANVAAQLSTRLTELVEADKYLRSTISTSTRRLLFNKSSLLPERSVLSTSAFALSNAIVQRLIFMKHVDVLVRCTSARQKRIAALNNSTQQIRMQCLNKCNNVASFEQLSGPAMFADSAANEFIRKWCLTKEDAEVIVNFADLLYLTEKLYCPDRAVAFVTVKNVAVEVRGGSVVNIVQCTLPSNSLIAINDTCVLFPREVDLNLAKSIDSLTMMDTGALPNTFVDLVTDPNKWNALPVTHPPTVPSFAGVLCSALDRSRVQVNLVYQNVISLTGDTAESPFAKVAPLSGVQAQAFQQLLHDKLTIVWGPPGTGKTHFAAKSMLNLIEMAARHNSISHLRILVCATTHAAIDEILSKFVMLKSLAMSIPDRQDTVLWKEQCKVFKYKAKPTKAEEALDGVQYTEGPTVVAKCKFTVLGATTWSLYKKKKSKAGEFGAFERDFRGLFDVVVIDEASQMPVSDALMPLSCLKEGPGGRVLVVGDTMQLSPIFAYKFGAPPAGVPPVQSSVLECLLRTESNLPVDLSSVIEGNLPPPPRMIKLSENFRMNTALSKFTSRLYGSDYVPSGSSRNRSGLWGVKAGATLRTLLPGVFTGGRSTLPELVSLRLVPHKAVRKFSTSALRSNIAAGASTVLTPMSADELALTSEMEHIATEASMVAGLIDAMATSQTDVPAEEAAASLFACTPHNNQKASLTRALALQGRTGGCWSEIADTAERMQGQERDVVVICLGYMSAELVSREVEFLFSKQRLNVAISRAKKSCILVYTDAMVALNPEVIGNIEASKAYEHLLAFIAASEALGGKCDVPVVLNS